MKTVYVLGAMVGVGAFLYFRRSNSASQNQESSPSVGPVVRATTPTIGESFRPPPFVTPLINEDVKGSELPSRPSAPSMGAPAASMVMTGFRYVAPPPVQRAAISQVRRGAPQTSSSGRRDATRPDIGRGRRPGEPDFGGSLQ